MEKEYDLIVIGAGPGGYLPALRAAKAGKRTAVVEREYPGGTCLNHGCIPTKTYLHTAGLIRETQKAAGAGLIRTEADADMRRLKAYKDEVTQTLRDGIIKQFSACKIDLYKGNAVIKKDHLVRVVADVETDLRGRYILVASGSQPSPLPIAGIRLPGVENSTTMLEREALYHRLVIIGGGVIGMEFATVYSDLGCEVTVLEAMDRILPGMDKEISQNLKMIMKKRGVKIHAGASVESIEKQDDGSLLCNYVEKGERQSLLTEGILAAVGRKPCGKTVFSDECREDIVFNREYIAVNDRYETSVQGIYAVGDVIGGVCLAHAATAEGYTALSYMFKELPEKNMSVIPSCVYTDPEIACVGLTPEEAKAAGIDIIAGKYLMSVNGKSVLSMQERGFVKVVAERQSGKILGAQLMCARATDMIGELALAVTKGLTIKDLAEVIMPHPTFCEGVGECCEDMSEI